MLNIITKATTALANATGRTGLLVAKHSPEIFTGIGIGCMTLGTISACKSTLKVDEVLSWNEEKKATIKRVREEQPEAYSEQDMTKDQSVLLVQTGVKMVKLYTPAFIFTGVGIASILLGHRILNARHIKAMAAYATISEGFKQYRGRVVSELGEEADKRFRYGFEKKEIEVDKFDENGEPTGKTKKSKEYVVDTKDISEYAKFFDSGSPHWSKSPEYNLNFLKSQQAYANQLLHSRGHVFLNDIYDALGLPRTSAGATVGWVDGLGDSFIDFGIFSAYNERARDFVNGYENVILLDFNVDGPIWDKI